MSFKINCEWLDDKEYPLHGKLSIYLDGNCLTNVIEKDIKEVRDHIFVDIYDVAEWIAYNWWSLLYEPKIEGSDWYESHDLARVGHGYVLPKIQFEPVDENMMIVSGLRTPDAHFHPITYLDENLPINVKLQVNEVETELALFLDKVADRINETDHKRLDGTDFYRSWEEVKRDYSKYRYLNIMAARCHYNQKEIKKYIEDNELYEIQT